MKTKIAIITHGFTTKVHCLPICSAFNDAFDVTWQIVDYGWPVNIKDILNYKNMEAIIWFVGFKHLRRKQIDWGNFTGKRILFDLDVCQNYDCGITCNSPYKGKWPIVFSRQKFDLLICTGKKTTERLIEEGINAYWVPKAFSGKIFYDKETNREKEICYYGRMYPERKVMKDFLIKHKCNVERIYCFYFSLNDFLNEYKICTIYNGIEPMIKQFETAASGCVPFCNAIPELSDLGFIDGENMVSYSTFEELLEKINYYLKSDELYKIGKASAKLAKEKHSWQKRMELFKEIII